MSSCSTNSSMGRIFLRRESDGACERPPSRPPKRGYLDSNYRKISTFADHRLTSFRAGESEVERLAKRIETRRRDRLCTTTAIRRQMIHRCHLFQTSRNRPSSKIHVDDLREYLSEVQERVAQEEQKFSFKKSILSLPTDAEVLLKVLNKAVELVAHDHEDEWFHYMDFTVYYTTTKPQYVILTHPLVMSLAWIFLFYLFTPLWFCVLARDDGVCEENENGEWGWMSSIYFASATLSTVGYGDVSVTYEDKWKAISGILYMILANLTLFCAFSSSDQSFSPFRRINDYLIELVMGHGRFCNSKSSSPDNLYSNLRRLRIMRLGQMFLTFLFLNLSGALVARIVTMKSSVGGEPMDWVTSLYWAVQTTTTIGYGDVPTSYSLRWFQIFYLILSTYFVGQTLGGLASLKLELQDVRTITAWKRRELSKGLIEELQPEEHDDKVDQFEFLVASLVTLNKLNYDDIKPIMNKYRELANDSGFISISDAKDMATTDGLDEDMDLSSNVLLQGVKNIKKTVQRGGSFVSHLGGSILSPSALSRESSIVSSRSNNAMDESYYTCQQHSSDLRVERAFTDSSADFEQYSTIGKNTRLSPHLEEELELQESMHSKRLSRES
eukprot:CAMPEP_0202463698 /NCGR_PEP_ID=MMETSP1360-20130828/59171_1 /ASSEMBLY_ACC=CAM_ASM_000848 /TAXON_ID=515479 /ORGANISM="Licmophora paradoxa, Strain CCMP2313" /LENGTH=611 /DNA_ID=CAMNT_0049086701 /DNA_START=42 /DNA_END=1877 /DNA_ORIENTATION=+